MENADPGLLAYFDRLVSKPRDETPVAVFDADGTLWAPDSSDSLLSWVDARGLVDPPVGSSALRAHGDALVAVCKRIGYAWAAMAMAGRTPDEVAQWAEASYVEYIAPHRFVAMEALLLGLMEAGWDVFVVSASPRWAVLPGTDRIGVPRDRVLAIEIEVADGRLTGIPRPGITQGPGKVTRIQRDIGRVPVFGAGNSVDDLPMLRHVSEGAVVVNPGAMDVDPGWHRHVPA